MTAPGVSIENLEQLAQKAGLFPLREPQRRALVSLLSGRNLLLIWPTGSGKSLCYQLPALVLPGVTVVISPLIALMEDQVTKGRAHGWPVTCVHSGVRKDERERRLKQVVEGKIRLLYVTPERFRQSEFLELIQTVKVALMAVDEAHCISQWGHDFRPDYSRMGEVRKALGDPPVIALTATATREVQADILKQLHLAPESTTLMWEGVERPGLFLAAVECEGFAEKLRGLKGWLGEVKGPKIVYFTLISTLQKVAAQLDAMEFATYHGDLEDRERKRSQQEFQNGGRQLMLATSAFGLGIDKADVRGVAHFEIPPSLEAYFQEVGRAGRDQGQAQCKLFYGQEDLETQMRFIETLTPDPDYIRAVYNLLVSWQGRLSTVSLEDLRAQLSFKNKRDFRLETTLNILERWDVIHYPQKRLNRLTLLRPLGEDDLNADLWKARKLQLQKKLLALVQWFRGAECRKVGIYTYLGWPDSMPCGFCDNCVGGARE